MENVLIAGGSGFIGHALCEALASQNFKVSLLSRKPEKIVSFPAFAWDPIRGKIDSESLKKADVMINLSGAGIADKIWTSKRKSILLESRIKSTRLLIDSLKHMKHGLKLFVNASAIGYYGNRPGEILHEDSDPGSGFLSRVCVAWEQEALRIKNLGIPLAILRTGIVFSNRGGSFPLLSKPLKKRINVLFGKGEHYISWVHLQDLIRIITGIITQELKPGIYNCVAPCPVRQKYLNEYLCRCMEIKAVKIKLPVNMLRLIAGERSSLFTDHQNISPANLLSQNFSFVYPDIHSAANDLVPPRENH